MWILRASLWAFIHSTKGRNPIISLHRFIDILGPLWSISNRNIHNRHIPINVNLAARYFSLRYPAYEMYVSNFRSSNVNFNPGNWYLHRTPTYQAFPIGASTLATSLLWILQANIWHVDWPTTSRCPIIGLNFDNCNLHTYLNILILKHNEMKHHRLRMIDSKTPPSSGGCGSPEDARDCDAQRDRSPTLAENVGALQFCFLVPQLETFKFQYPSALLSGNISKPLSSVSELTSPCTSFPLT